MYAHIDGGIEDDECKRKFEVELLQGMGKLGENIKRRFEQDEKQFRKDIKETIKQFEERIKDSLVMLNRTHTDSGFDPNFNTHSGINKIGLFASIGGLLLLLATPLGEIALAAGIVLGAIGIIKSAWSFIDSDYKKSQQKKEVDKNLDKVCEEIAEE
ncbi:apolipoL family protein [Helicobacter pylori]|uniref:apolipoL family protein n=1 Tax=Helicobacter pylori TaxID=210 RepID=UPI0026A32F71